MTNQGKETWLVWYWRYGGYYIEKHDALQNALDSAWWIDRGDDGVLAYVEGPDGAVSTDEYFAKREAEEADSRADAPRSTHGIKIIDLEGKGEAWWDEYASLEDAETAAADLRGRFGDRVLLGAIPWNFPKR